MLLVMRTNLNVEMLKFPGSSKDMFIVSEGLKEGEQVILRGFDKLTDGSVITPVIAH